MFKLGFFSHGSSGSTEVTIGTQIWSTKNLNVITYRNGDPISLATNAADWETFTALGEGCYASVDFDSANDIIYGKLYNGFALKDTRQLAPVGWHIPTEEEYYTLQSHLAANSLTGGDLKEVGTDHWNAPNTGATNTLGFTAVPGGFMNYLPPGGTITSGIGTNSYHSVYDLTTNNKYFYLNTSSIDIFLDYETSLEYGFSVRCIKNESLFVGQRFGGGVIYNMNGDPNQDSYEINVVYFDGSTAIVGLENWGCNGIITGASNEDDGYTNTQTVLGSACGSLAFSVLDGSTFFINYNDWFMPASNTLRTILNLEAASTIQLNVLVTDQFWSSTEDNGDPEFSAKKLRYISGDWTPEVDTKSTSYNITFIRTQYI